MVNPIRRSRGRTLWILLMVVLAAGAASLALRDRVRDAWDRASGMAEQRTDIGERRTVRLPDGSRVQLGVATTLRYATEFPPASRPVALAGEGFFAVAKDTTRPFVVTAGPAAVRATSAQFDVRAYPEENAARIVVDSGEVEVARASGVGGSWTLLPPRSLARVARDGAVTRRDSITPADFLGWRSGRIVFNDVPLRAALTELARWQDLDLQIGDSVVANRRVTATFASHQTVTEILDGIALQLGARYERSGRTIVFRRER